jgi:hypothetical protein
MFVIVRLKAPDAATHEVALTALKSCPQPFTDRPLRDALAHRGTAGDL